MNNAYTLEDLKTMQRWDLNRKIQVSQTKILEWYKHYEGECYVAFSGGKDSTVLADLVARVIQNTDWELVLWYSDTGLEYPEVREHVLNFGNWLQNRYFIKVRTIKDFPKDKKGNRITFREVIEKWGYPVVSKEQAKYIYEYRHSESEEVKRIRKYGDENGRYGVSQRYHYLLNAPFEISSKCCEVMKEGPSKKYEYKFWRKPLVGTMTCENQLRERSWLKSGCNAFNNKRPRSAPLSFWTEQDVLEYLLRYEVPYASVYGNIEKDENGYYTTGCKRTGCVFCMFGCQYEVGEKENRFQRLKKTHPKLWEYCMRPWDEKGLGMREVLEYMGIDVD